MKEFHTKQFAAAIALVLVSAAGYALPGGARAVQQLDKAKYLGKWHEIARMDFVFEKGLINTSAEYSLTEKGTIRVVNRGFDPKHNKWKKAEGTARFRSGKENGELEVSFFWPFYAEYNVIAIDSDYRYALVVGKSVKYMWILSREQTIPDEIKNEYVSMARSIGINTEKLVWVEQGN
jgi:Bacterial lipocalin